MSIKRGRKISKNNYRPKACLNLLWKLKTDIIAEKFYQHLENENLLIEEQKG